MNAGLALVLKSHDLPIAENCGNASNRKPLLAAMRPEAMVAALRLKGEFTMTKPDKVLFTAKVHTTGGREGASSSSDGRLNIKLSSPGGAGSGTNPEQLFAAGWSACFEGAMGLAARKMKIALPADTVIDAEVDLCLTDGAYFLQARLNVRVPGMERELALALVNAAHQTCPYSKATRGNVDVVISAV